MIFRWFTLHNVSIIASLTAERNFSKQKLLKTFLWSNDILLQHRLSFLDTISVDKTMSTIVNLICRKWFTALHTKTRENNNLEVFYVEQACILSIQFIKYVINISWYSVLEKLYFISLLYFYLFNQISYCWNALNLK